MAKDRYEISLWEDVLHAASGQVPAHYEEEKICVIGSDTMTSPCRAYEPQLVQNINGTNTLTFKMYYVYTEPFNETEKLQNPFISLLVNERKVKALWKDKWYDFVIKGIDENSVDKSITYTCIDQYINELSKTGFELEFDNELENNQGTVEELGAKVLEGSDWQIGSGDTIQQKVEEPVQEATVVKWFQATNQETGDTEDIGKSPADTKILVFYNQLQPMFSSEEDGKISSFQFLYSSDGFVTEQNKLLVTNGSCYSLNQIYYFFDEENDQYIFRLSNNDDPTTDRFYISKEALVSNDYRAERLVESQESVFDPTVNKWVLKYTKTVDGVSHEIHGYATTEYKDATFVNNLVVNSSNFSNVNGWLRTDNSNYALTWQLYPYFNSTIDENYKTTSYLKVKGPDSGKTTIKNTGFKESATYFQNGCTKGDIYVFRIRLKGKALDGQGKDIPSNGYISDPTLVGWSAKIKNTIDGEAERYFRPLNNSYYFDDYEQDTNYIRRYFVCTESFSKADIFNAEDAFFGLELTSTQNNSTYYIEDVQFFPKVDGNEYIITQDESPQQGKEYYIYDVSINNYIKVDVSTFEEDVIYYEYIGSNIILPGEMNKQPLVYEYYNYYDYTIYQDTSIDNIEFLYRGPIKEPTSLGLTKVINEDFVKIRSITAKNSNRFNLLQTLAETFGCWCKFEIEHISTGQISYVNGEPQKWVYFVNSVGQETGLSFTYGIDLKGITRNIQSDSIVTKTIVSPNSNEFGKNGFCTIARSDENYPRENFILDFGYYISHGLINGNELNRDLQGNVPGSGLNYFFTLHNLNTRYDANAEILTLRQNKLITQQSYQKTYGEYISSIDQEIANLKSQLYSLVNADNWNAVENYAANNPDNTEVSDRLAALSNANSKKQEYENLKYNITISINDLLKEMDNFKTEQEDLLEQIKAKHTEFNEKYFRFLQEGSWIDESYMDDNLYYLDAKSVAYTSSRPQVSQNISVARVSSLPEFQNRKFELGDIGYVQDTEFFGYKDDRITPYKEQILISEVTSHFDSPELDSFKVQNYKTQFEDLFQRITAATQSLQYSSGEYAKVATIINEDGTIKTSTLQNSIALNNELVFSSQNNTVIRDNTGITIVDTTEPNFQVKLNAQGIFITTDGGVTWKNAVRGEGIATQYLTAGSIATNNITIYDGEYPSFKWDSRGINAYDFIDPTQNYTVNINKYVRFDHYGIYGINGIANYNPDAIENPAYAEDDIWDKAQFGMTWKGFFVKNKYNGHYVEVSSEHDIQVVDTSNNVVRVKIGELENNNYGFRINNASGAAVLEAGSDGLLWLKKELNISSTSGSGQNIRLGYLTGETDHEQRYTPTSDVSKQSGKTYQVYDDNTGTYIEFEGEAFEEDVIYYEFKTIFKTFDVNNKFIVYEDGSINANEGTFSGIIHARGGDFTGIINATGGKFTGEIVANSGRIGPFVITNDGATIGIEDAGLSFDANGLALIDGGLTMQKTVNDELVPVFSQNPESGDLQISGIINASGGIIGGFVITENELYSSDLNNSIRLQGTTGKIIANNIELGIGAEIADQLQLGHAKFYNPIQHDSLLLESPVVNNDEPIGLRIYDDGRLFFGNEIAINGTTSTIDLGGSDGIHLNGSEQSIYAGNGWGSFSIKPDGAFFTNVTVAGTISTAVFEVGHVQAVGGAMIFKPSQEVVCTGIGIDNEKYQYELENFDDGGLLDSNEIIYAVLLYRNDSDSNSIVNEVNIYGTIIKTEDELFWFYPEVYDATFEKENVIGLIILGQEGSAIIGVNSSDSINNFALRPRGITISEVELNNNGTVNINAKPRTFLGDFKNANIPNTAGYGLYSDNVYLNGSLITVSQNNNKYAGINTLSQIPASIFSSDDTSPIVFWGGANSTESEDIQRAPFQVTENGSLYAQNGIFKGSLLVNSAIEGGSIYGADIYTARIHGYSSSGIDGLESRGYALQFNDVQYGMQFTTSKTENEYVETIDREPREGVVYYTYDENTNNYIEFTGNSFEANVDYYIIQTTISEVPILKIQEDSLLFVKENNTDYTFARLDNNQVILNSDISNSIEYNTLNLQITQNFIKNSNSISQITFNNESVDLNAMSEVVCTAPMMRINQELNLGLYNTNQYHMQYRPITESNNVGYDLYIM